MSEYLGRDTVPDSAIYATDDVSHTSYTISSGMVGSSLRRPRTLLERPDLTLPRFLLEVVRALFVERLSGGKDAGRTEKNIMRSPFRDVGIADPGVLASRGSRVGGGTHHVLCGHQRYRTVMRNLADQSLSTRKTPGERRTMSCRCPNKFSCCQRVTQGEPPGSGFIPPPHTLRVNFRREHNEHFWVKNP
jgi:hypothetical protein